MSLAELWYQFTVQLMQTTVLEAVAVLFGVISVVLANRNHVLLYPTGIISTSLYLYIMTSVGLYAEALLNGYYLVMSIYGWVRWSMNKENMNAASISYANKRDWMVTSAIVVLGFMIMFYTLSNYTDSEVPFWDAIVASFAWAGMWLLAKHKIENWVLLNISNLIAIPLFVYKGIPLTSVLTIILFTVAVFGYFRWKRLHKLQEAS